MEVAPGVNDTQFAHGKVNRYTSRCLSERPTPFARLYVPNVPYEIEQPEYLESGVLQVDYRDCYTILVGGETSLLVKPGSQEEMRWRKDGLVR